jgi:hypothetical protein
MALRFSSNFRAEVLGQRRILPVLEMVLPDKTWRLAGSPIAIKGQGQYEPRIRKGGWGSVSSGGTDRNGKLEAVQTSVTCDDTDRAFMALKYGARGPEVRGSAATMKCVLTHGAYADAWTFFRGIVWDIEHGANRSAKILFRVDDLPLQREVPKLALASYFPAAKADALGLYAPVVYGVHDSTGLSSDKGMIKALHVDTIGNRYLVTQGWAKSVRRVYVGGVLQTTGFTITNPEINGVRWTLVDFNNPQTEDVTVDVEGLEATGDGSGALLTNPVTQLKHWLVNFVWNTYRSGTYFLDASAPIDVASFTEAADFLDVLGMPGSHIFPAARTTGEKALSEFVDQMNMQCFWSDAGTLSIRPRPARETDLYGDSEWIRYGDGKTMRDFAHKEMSDGIADAVSVRHAFFHAQNDYAQELDVRDASVGDSEAPVSIAMSWAPSYIV